MFDSTTVKKQLLKWTRPIDTNMKVSIIEDESILRQLSMRGAVRDKVQSNRQDCSAFGNSSATTVDVVSYRPADMECYSTSRTVSHGRRVVT